MEYDRNGDLLGIEAAGKGIRRFGKDGKVTEVTRGDGVDAMLRPDGLTITLDSKRLIVDDTLTHTIWKFDIQADGRLANRRSFATRQNIDAAEDSGGDGLAIDREGRLFVTNVTGIQNFDRDGNYLGNIAVPRKSTNVAFAGPNRSAPYITARGGDYRIQTLTQGPDRLGK